MKSITKASRINAVTQVIQYMNSGHTVVLGGSLSGRLSLHHIVVQIGCSLGVNILPLYDVN